MEYDSLSLQETIDLFPDGVIIVDTAGQIVKANERAEKLFGYPSAGLNNQHLNILIPNRFHPQHKGHLKAYNHQPEVRGMGTGKPLFGLRKDGSEFDVSIALSPIELSKKKLVLATIRDISEKKDLERALQWRNEQLEAINTELERFGFTISHDLKSPLANIQAIIHLITRELPNEKKEELSGHINMLNQTLLAMSDLISGVAAYSKASMAENTSEVIDMDAMMKEVRYLTLLPPHIELNIDDHLPDTWGNKTKFLQVFLNLISNAVKYNNKQKGIIRISGKLSAKKVCFTIEDNGPGIEPELWLKVFTVFEKGRSTRKDSQGIGLAIVSKIILELGGIIAISESKLGGAKFRITLPLRSKKNQRAESKPAVKEKKKKKI